MRLSNIANVGVHVESSFPGKGPASRLSIVVILIIDRFHGFYLGFLVKSGRQNFRMFKSGNNRQKLYTKVPVGRSDKTSSLPDH